MSYLITAIFHELVHQLDHLAGVRRVAQSRIGLRKHAPRSYWSDMTAQAAGQRARLACPFSAPSPKRCPCKAKAINLFDKSSRAPPRGRVPLARRRKIREVRPRAPCWQATSDDSVRAVAQLGRAPGSGPGGRGFKSHQPDNLCCEAVERLGSSAHFLLM